MSNKTLQQCLHTAVPMTGNLEPIGSGFNQIHDCHSPSTSLQPLPVQPQYDVYVSPHCCNMLIDRFKETNQLIFHKKLIAAMALNK